VESAGILEVGVEGVHEFAGLTGGGAGGDVDVSVDGGGLLCFSGFCLGVSDIRTIGDDFIGFGYRLDECFDLGGVNLVDLLPVCEVDELSWSVRGRK